jgi:O-antigen ligase
MRDREQIDGWLERAIVLLVLGAVVFASVLFGATRATELAGVTGLLGLASVLWVVRLWINPSHRFLLHPVLLPIAGFVAYAAWRTSLAEVPYAARQELWLLVLYALAFVLVLQNLHGQDTLVLAVHVLVGLGILLSLYSVIQFLSKSDRILWLPQPPQYFRRAGSTFINPNHFAALMVMLLPLALGQVFLGRDKGPLRIIHGYGAAMMCLGLAFSMSRGGWLAGGVVLLLFFLWLLIRRRNLRIPALSALGVVLVGIAVFLGSNAKAQRRLEGLAQGGTPDAAGRAHLWRPALAMWNTERWFGVGPAHYDLRFPGFRDPGVQTNPGYVHNEYLNTLTDYGLAGAGLAAAGVLTLVGGILKSRKYVERGASDLGSRNSGRGSNRTAFFLGGCLALLGLAIHCVGDFLLHIPALGLVAALLAALLASTLRFATDDFWVTPRWWSRIPATALVGAGLAFVVPAAAAYGQEGLELNRAARRRAVTPELIANLTRAAALQPGNPRTAYELGENYRRLSFQGESLWQQEATNALQWLDRAVKVNPRDPLPHLSLGLTWHWLGDAARAKREFERAVDLGPNDLNVHNYYAWNLLTQGRVKKARAVFEQTLIWNSWDNWFARRYADEIDRGIWKDTEKSAP